MQVFCQDSSSTEHHKNTGVTAVPGAEHSLKYLAISFKGSASSSRRSLTRFILFDSVHLGHSKDACASWQITTIAAATQEPLLLHPQFITKDWVTAMAYLGSQGMQNWAL